MIPFDKTTLIFISRMENMKSFEAPTDIFSASLHPTKSCFVAGGDDFKLYKFDYTDGKELGKYIKLLVCRTKVDKDCVREFALVKG